MKIGLFADPHINVFRKSNSFLKYVDSAFQEFKDICIQNKVGMIIGCGDIFHTKSYVATDALIFANNLINSLSSIAPLVLFAGNHDMIQYSNTSVNLLHNYLFFDNVRVITEEYELRIGGDFTLHFVPFNPDEQKLAATIRSIVPDDDDYHRRKNIIFSHCGIRGASYRSGEGYDTEDQDSELTVNDFKKFDMAFLGHYHGFQERENVVYISSPFQSRFGDEFSRHGFIIFDTDTMEYNFYETQNSPNFVTLDFTKENIKELLKLKNMFIKLVVKKHISKELLSVIKTKLLASNVSVEYKFDIPINNTNFVTLEGFDAIKYTTTEDLLVGYANHVKDTIEYDLETLLNIILR